MIVYNNYVHVGKVWFQKAAQPHPTPELSCSDSIFVTLWKMVDQWMWDINRNNDMPFTSKQDYIEPLPVHLGKYVTW